jgi:hypothetical protein
MNGTNSSERGRRQRYARTTRSRPSPVGAQTQHAGSDVGINDAMTYAAAWGRFASRARRTPRPLEIDRFGAPGLHSAAGLAARLPANGQRREAEGTIAHATIAGASAFGSDVCAIVFGRRRAQAKHGFDDDACRRRGGRRRRMHAGDAGSRCRWPGRRDWRSGDGDDNSLAHRRA